MSHSKTKDIVISHSGRQHAYRLIDAVTRRKEERVIFFTTLWFENIPKWIRWLPSSVKRRLTNEFHKRKYQFNGNLLIHTRNFKGLIKELADRAGSRNGVDRRQLALEKSHDRFVAKKIRSTRPALVIGYEISSVDTFKNARSQGAITILDLAQVHFKTLATIAARHDALQFLLDDPLRKEIDQRKLAEYELADYFIVISGIMKKSLLDNGIAANRIFSVNLGFEPQIFVPKTTYSANGDLNLLYCGIVSKQKGILVLLQAMEQLAEKGIRCNLVVIGPAGDAISEVKSARYKGRVQYFSYMPHEELSGYYRQADLFLFPTFMDSWGMVVLEAMACGTPVIVTENAGCCEAVTEMAGKIVPAGNSEAIAKAIAFYHEDRQQLEIAGKLARKIAEKYTWENYNNQIDQILDQILIGPENN